RRGTPPARTLSHPAEPLPHASAPSPTSHRPPAPGFAARSRRSTSGGLPSTPPSGRPPRARAAPIVVAWVGRGQPASGRRRASGPGTRGPFAQAGAGAILGPRGTCGVAQAIDVARYLIQLAAAEDEPELLSHLRLQKLLYYVQGWSLAQRRAPMFS